MWHAACLRNCEPAHVSRANQTFRDDRHTDMPRAGPARCPSRRASVLMSRDSQARRLVSPRFQNISGLPHGPTGLIGGSLRIRATDCGEHIPMFCIRRRDFIALLGGAASSWPLGVRAQQPGMPVIGYLSGATFEMTREYVAAFHQGLADAGFAEGRNVAIEYRWAEGHNERLPALATDLIRREVAVIAVVG